LGALNLSNYSRDADFWGTYPAAAPPLSEWPTTHPQTTLQHTSRWCLRAFPQRSASPSSGEYVETRDFVGPTI